MDALVKYRRLGGATFAKSRPVYRGKSMEYFASVIEDDESVAAPRIAAYLRHFHSVQLGITTETIEETLTS